MAELNELLRAYDLADDNRRIAKRTLRVGEHFRFEQPLLRPLPTKRISMHIDRISPLKCLPDG